MKINLNFKKFIILFSIVVLCKGYFFADFASKNKDYKDKYGVYLVFSE